MNQVKDSKINKLEDFGEKLEKYIENIDKEIQKLRNGENIERAVDERLLSVFLLHLDEYSQRLKEIGGFGVGGVEANLSLPLEGGAFEIDTTKNKRC